MTITKKAIKFSAISCLLVLLFTTVMISCNNAPADDKKADAPAMDSTKAMVMDSTHKMPGDTTKMKDSTTAKPDTGHGKGVNDPVIKKN